MEQPSLFDEVTTGDARAVASFVADFRGWQAAARAQLLAETPPEAVWWQPVSAGEAKAFPVTPADTGPRVPKAFVGLARAASCHCSPDRWALMYQLLWRLTHGERHLLQLGGDPQVARITAYAKAVRRDVHKMKAFVRFRAVAETDAPDGEPRYVAWFEPEHFIVAYASGFFRRRFANMRWSILTPYGCAHYDGPDMNNGAVWFSPGTDKSAAPDDDVLEDAWRTYYRSIFNPARVKIRAMQSEMPVKYWKNMPEAQLIPQLLRDADRRVAAMEDEVGTTDALQCGPRPATPDAHHAEAVARSAADSLERLALQARTCRRCPLWEPATQTVFGEGPRDARVMIVGEQPGDAEDLAGRPFVGPAGRLLDRSLAQAGIDCDALYLTNAVKHFKFAPRGKQRLHVRPADPEVFACKSWLDNEIDLLDPALIVAMGATAAQALLGRPVRITHERGTIVQSAHGGGRRRILLTVHPSYLLRLPDADVAARASAQFTRDLAQACDWL
ncbi:UdgX family uracil-DNA binding protein [Salinisphaera aquimarina]|uniref:Type-4 uracil-DNA glycosylase n=1 Tax=Salinisphaera aquimarina TaxID=2094031 RepID=A0ABV7EK41_9GAMM